MAPAKAGGGVAEALIPMERQWETASKAATPMRWR
jgi:hypothetical protein